MANLTPEERLKIYEEEKARVEAQAEINGGSNRRKIILIGIVLSTALFAIIFYSIIYVMFLLPHKGPSEKE